MPVLSCNFQLFPLGPMVKPSDSNGDFRSGHGSPPPAEDAMTSVQQELKRGLAALKVKDYDTALRIFQQLEQTAPEFKTKARMGMIQAYQQSGNTELAREQCQELLTSTSPKVCQWAQQMLAKLPPPADASQEASSLLGKAPPLEDRDDFVPQDKSGFVPLEPVTEEKLQLSAVAPSLHSKVSDETVGLTSVGDSSATAETETETAPFSKSEQHQSLFHYRQLNRQTGGSDAEEPLLAGKMAPPAEGTRSHLKPSVRPVPQETQQPLKQRHSSSSTAGLELVKPYRLWIVQSVTAIAILWLTHWGIYQGLQLVNDAIRFIRWPIRLRGFDAFDEPHFWLIVVLGILITLASPWLFDRLLALLYRQKSLSSRQLQSQCPDALRLMRRICRQRGWQMPELRLIPDTAPLCFSYGWSPQTARIVISQGLLESLADEELTALFTYELSHLANWDMPVLSGLSFLLLIVYSGYWYLAQWGERKQGKWLRVIAGVMASGFYGLFWLLRKLGLWLSRVRGKYCDYTSLTMTRQPGHHQRLLLGLTQRVTQDINQRGYLHPLLVSLDLLMSLSPNQAVSPGSFLNQVGLSRLIAEDCLNRYRHWLVANNSHPILGERLLFFEHWANHWNQPSLGLTIDQLAAEQPEEIASGLTLRDLAIQNSALVGLIVGGGIALSLWFIGGLVNRLNWQQLSWLYQDDSILWGGLLIGLGMGILMRVNRLFPESRPPQAIASSAETLFRRLPTLPVNGHFVILQGTLTGTAGMLNVLCQNLYLQEEKGFLRLKAASPFGWWRGLLGIKPHPALWIGRQATVSGWQRRAGGLLWLDVNTIQVTGQPVYQVHAPQWMTALAILISLWGVWIIFSGG